MSTVLAIARRELQAYFVSPIAYVVIVIFLVLVGAGFLRELFVYAALPEMMLQRSGADIRTWVVWNFSVRWIAIGLFVALPGLSMRLLSEERKTGTAELLMTSPLTTVQLVLGKYLGTLIMLVLALALTTPVIGVLLWKGEPEMLAIGTAYLGYFLFGAVILAIGLFASALTENQIVALLLTYALFFPLWMLELAIGALLSDFISDLSVSRGLSLLAQGLIDSHYLVLDGVLIFLFLFLCAQVIDSNRWR